MSGQAISRRSIFALAVLVAVAAGSCSSEGGAPDDEGQTASCGADAIDALDASALASSLRENVTVEGEIVDTAYVPAETGEPTFLNFVDADSGFYLLIWEENRSSFETPFGTPETRYLNEHVCVSGELGEHNGRPQIVLRNTDQIRIVSDEVAAPTHEPATAEPEETDDLSGPPVAHAVSDTINAFYDAINDSEYATAWELQTAERQSLAEGGYGGFAEGHSTTIVSDLVVQNVSRNDDETALAYVTFKSEQEARHGPQGQTCTLWTLDFYMARVAGDWLIDRAVGHDGGSEGEAC